MLNHSPSPAPPPPPPLLGSSSSLRSLASLAWTHANTQAKAKKVEDLNPAMPNRLYAVILPRGCFIACTKNNQQCCVEEPFVKLGCGTSQQAEPLTDTLHMLSMTAGTTTCCLLRLATAGCGSASPRSLRLQGVGYTQQQQQCALHLCISGSSGCCNAGRCSLRAAAVDGATHAMSD
jgi:hypothetical protein